MENSSVALLFNPLSHDRRRYAVRLKVIEQLRRLNVYFDLFETDWPEAFDDRTHILLVGGDGTLNYFINKYPSNTVPLSIIKAGTGNDFAWKLFGNISLEAQVRVAIHGSLRRVDAGICNGRYFLNGVGVGFDGAVVKKMNASRRWFNGYLPYYVNVLKVISSYRSVNVTISTAGNPSLRDQRAFMLTIANGSRYGGNFMVAPGADISDGLLNFVMIKPVPVWLRYFHLPSMKKGKHLRLPFVSQLQLSQVTITSVNDLPARLDGEPMLAKRFDIEVLPGRFLFRC
jgi:YegS/Rv2252/BmrU family lipid kinase